MTAETPKAFLDPKTVARRLRRSLVGDPSSAEPTDEYLLLHLLNSAQRDGLEELLARPEASRRIGADLIALVRNRLRRGPERSRGRPGLRPGRSPDGPPRQGLGGKAAGDGLEDAWLADGVAVRAQQVQSGVPGGGWPGDARMPALGNRLESSLALYGIGG